MVEHFARTRRGSGSRSLGQRLAAASLSAVVLLATTATSSDASDRGITFDPPAVSGVDALRSDAVAYAAEFGVGTDVALERLLLMEQLDGVLGPAIKAAGERYAGSWIEHVPGFRVVLSLTGTEPAQKVQELVSEIPIPVEVRTRAQYSLRDLMEGQERLDPALVANADSYSLIDVPRNQVVVRSGGSLGPSDAERLAGIAASAVRVEDALPLEGNHTYGGRQLILTGGYCTTGFTARNPNGVRGVVSSAHCPNGPITYRQQGNITYPLYFRAEYWEQDEDWQFMDEPYHAVEPIFWNGDVWVTVTNPLPPSDSVMIGQFVCHYGVGTQQKSCGTIYTTTLDPGNICGPTGSGNCYPTWIGVTGSNLACAKGDSGGPWYKGSRAYGLHTYGSSTGTGAGQCQLAVFMSTYYLPPRGYAVLTG